MFFFFFVGENIPSPSMTELYECKIGMHNSQKKKKKKNREMKNVRVRKLRVLLFYISFVQIIIIK